MTDSMPWAQICIVHDDGYSVIGNGYQTTSTSHDVPKLGSRVPVVDMKGIAVSKWQRVLHDYISAAEIEDLEFLLEDLEKLKEEK